MFKPTAVGVSISKQELSLQLISVGVKLVLKMQLNGIN